MVYFRKKYFCLFFLTVFFACKKDRTCSCTVTDSGKSTTTAQFVANIGPIPVVLFDTSFTTSFSETDSRDIVYKKIKKGDAKKNCISYSEPYKENTYNSVPNFSLVTTREGTRTYDCKLK